MTLTTLPAHLMPMVEKAARRIFNASCGGLLPDWVEESKWNEAIAIAEADALAFLNACLDGGVAINGHYVDKFHKTSPALILTLGEAK